VANHHLTYSFAAGGGCGSLTTAGKDTNRTAMTDNGGTPTTYCYNGLDQLTSSSDLGTLVYNSHGDTTTMGTQTMGYDGADRHVHTTAGTTNVDYVRDASGRITQRTEASTVTRYAYADGSDSPVAVLDWQQHVISRTVPLLRPPAP
jgi:YD repeat-containing protein